MAVAVKTVGGERREERPDLMESDGSLLVIKQRLFSRDRQDVDCYKRLENVIITSIRYKIPNNMINLTLADRRDSFR